jgi:hypothetical protein
MIITGRTPGQQNLLVRAVDGILGTHRMVTVAKWRDGAIAEEYIWM